MQLQAMCELCLFSECLALLAEIQSGARLPQSSSEHSRPPDTHVVSWGGWWRRDGGGKEERWRGGREGEKEGRKLQLLYM